MPYPWEVSTFRSPRRVSVSCHLWPYLSPTRALSCAICGIKQANRKQMEKVIKVMSFWEGIEESVWYHRTLGVSSCTHSMNQPKGISPFRCKDHSPVSVHSLPLGLLFRFVWAASLRSPTNTRPYTTRRTRPVVHDPSYTTLRTRPLPVLGLSFFRFEDGPAVLAGGLLGPKWLPCWRDRDRGCDTSTKQTVVRVELCIYDIRA